MSTCSYWRIPVCRCVRGVTKLAWISTNRLERLLVQTLGYRLQLAALGDTDGGDRVTVLHVRSYAYRKIKTDRLVNRRL